MILRRGLIGLAGLLLVGGGGEPAVAQRGLADGPEVALSSPLKPAPERIMTPRGVIRPEAVPLSIDMSMLRELKKRAPGQQLRLRQFVLEPGLAVDLEVSRIEPFAPGAQVVLMEANGVGGIRERKVPIPDQVILAGRVAGQPDSRVVLGLAGEGCNGYIQADSGLYLLASPADMAGPPVIYPVGDRAGAIPLVPKLFPIGFGDPGEPPAPEAPRALRSDRGSQKDDSSRSNAGSCGASRCCIESPFTDYNQWGQPDDWTCISVGSHEECLDAYGVYQDTTWTSNQCNATYSTHITGACCLLPMEPDPVGHMCVQRTLADCESLNGLFAGRHTTCNEGMCVSYGLECFHATLGIETDDEFLLVFDGNVQKAINYIALLVGASSEIFDDNIRLKFQIRTVRLWSEGIDPWPFDDFEVDFQNLHDPYTSGTEDTIIKEMRYRWVTDPPPGAEPLETLHVIHMLSGQSLGYGYVSQLGSICVPDDVACGITSGIHGSFPYPVVDFHPDNWDLMFFTQVMGRLAGARYTHWYTEDAVQHHVYLDRCGSLYEPSPCDLPVSFPPSLMSWCYRCPGGVSNISMKFHPYVRGEMFKRLLESPCFLYDYPNVQAVDDIGFTVPGLPVTLDVLSNDRVYGCQPFTTSTSTNYLDIDTKDTVGEPNDDYPRTTPLGGYLTTTPDPSDDVNDYPDVRKLIYIPPCDLFDGVICPSGNALMNWPDNGNSTGWNHNTTDYPYWSHYVDSFAYRANMNSTLHQDPTEPGHNDNATVRVVVSPPPMNWPSACLAGINWDATGPFPVNPLDLSVNLAIDPKDPAGEPYDVRVLAFGFLNLKCCNFNSSTNACTYSPPEVCFEFYVDDALVKFDINGGLVDRICPWDPTQEFFPDFINGNCSGFVFIGDEPNDYYVLNPLNTNGDLRVDVVWNPDFYPPPPGQTDWDWFDGRLYVQLDDNFGACEFTSLPCECLSETACLEQGGIFRGRGSACPGLDPWDPPQQACTLIAYGACQFGAPSTPASYSCECLSEIECSVNGGTFLGAGEPCPEIPGVPKGPACLTFDLGACCFGTNCFTVDWFDNKPYTAVTCEMAGGVFRGVGTSCDVVNTNSSFVIQDICGSSPPVGLGACCVPQSNSSCLCGITTEAVCLNNNGTYSEYWSAPGLGDNNHCFAQTCNFEYHPASCFNFEEHEGACCLTAGGCLVTTAQNCWALNGAFEGYQGDGIPCGPGLCDVGSGLGACCLDSGACMNLTQAECDALPTDTTFYSGQLCNGVQCPADPATLFGACCLGPLYCLDGRSQQECLALQGEFKGDNSDCSTVECNIGACCTGAVCTDQMSVGDCITLGGTYLGPDRTCAGEPCNPTGLCCVDQICYRISQADCTDLLGNYLGQTLDTCESGVCLRGACCVSDTVCLEFDNQSSCMDIGGVWKPYGSSCSLQATCSGSSNNCDVNGDGTTDISDFLMILQHFGSGGGQGDYNGDGHVDVDDLLDYLADCA